MTQHRIPTSRRPRGFGRAGRAVAGALFTLFALAWTSTASGQQDLDEARVFFRDNCARCHTIGGGRLTGPDLQNVQLRQQREWLVTFLLDPQARIDAGDPYALALLDSARGVVMPQVAGMDTERARSLLDLIEQESALESSEFSTPQVPADPFTDSDRAIGQLLFTGKAPLRSGAPPCSGCHDLAGLEGWGGGRLAPDLSRAWERLGGRSAVADWLQSPASAGTGSGIPMAVAHRPMETSEIHPLSAALEAAARRGTTRPARAQLVFSATAWLIAAAALCLLALLQGWRHRRRADEGNGREPSVAAWAVPSLLLGLSVVAALHVLPLLLPGTVLDLVQRPRGLWRLETAHLAAGLLAACGLVGLWRSPRRDPDDRRGAVELAFVGTLVLAVVSGVLVGVFQRWGLAWLAGWWRPALGAVLRGEAESSGLLAGMPSILLFHVACGLLSLVLLPFTRWRRWLHPRHLDPRRVPWRALDPRRWRLPGRRRRGAAGESSQEPTEEAS